MRRQDRIQHAKRILRELQELEASWRIDNSQQQQETSRRERLKNLEAQLAVIRFLQSERRLMQQLWIALPSLLGGSFITLLFQRFFG